MSSGRWRPFCLGLNVLMKAVYFPGYGSLLARKGLPNTHLKLMIIVARSGRYFGKIPGLEAARDLNVDQNMFVSGVGRSYRTTLYEIPESPQMVCILSLEMLNFSSVTQIYMFICIVCHLSGGTDSWNLFLEGGIYFTSSVPWLLMTCVTRASSAMILTKFSWNILISASKELTHWMTTRVTYRIHLLSDSQSWYRVRYACACTPEDDGAASPKQSLDRWSLKVLASQGDLYSNEQHGTFHRK